MKIIVWSGLLIMISFIGTCLADYQQDSPAGNGSPPGDPLPFQYQKDPVMKTIGVIGGIGWSSSHEYYRLLNEMVNKRMGGDYSASILMYSIDFGTFSQQERLALQGDWNSLRKTMIDAGARLKNGGADFIIICSNTMHSTAGDIHDHTALPVIHIADATGKKIQESGIRTVGLLGTRYTMEHGFYTEILEKKYGLTVIVPDETDRELINTIIFDELVNNVIREESRQQFITIINSLVDQGAEGIVLGCTEIPLLIQQDDVRVEVFDTMTIHAAAAVDYAMNSSPGAVPFQSR